MKTGRNVAWAVAAWVLLSACSAFPHTVADLPVPRATRAGAIARGLEYLWNTQITPEDEARGVRNWAGNWPFYATPRLPFVRMRVVEIASGLPAYMHGALSVIHEGTADGLGLTSEDVCRARTMRRRAMAFMERFRSPGPDPVAYGWSPRRRVRNRGLARILAANLESQLGGPSLYGDRAPPGIPAFPPSFCLAADVDDTALVLGARLDHTHLDGGEPAPTSIAELFVPWRDLPGVHRRFPDWQEEASGAYLTWMVDPRPGRAANDLDLVINANVLWVLARYGELDAPGADAAVEFVLEAVRDRRYRRAADFSLWYPRLYLHFAVARAFAEGPVPGLAPAVEGLVEDLVACARWRPDGTVSWGRPRDADEAFHTTLAVLALLHADREHALSDAGCRRLLQLQDPVLGAWPEATLCWGRSTTGVQIVWRTAAMPTAFAIEALCRARLRRHPGGRNPADAVGAP